MSTRPALPRHAEDRPRFAVRDGGLCDLDGVMDVMVSAFPSELGEAWTRSQCAGILPLPGVRLRIAENGAGKVVGFALDRRVADEAELLLIAVSPTSRRAGVGETLIRDFVSRGQDTGVRHFHLEVRDGNPAEALYHRLGFETVGRRHHYYKGSDGHRADALTLARDI
jgi:ribosomal-protein-alanine N-acetyltransferase